MMTFIKGPIYFVTGGSPKSWRSSRTGLCRRFRPRLPHHTLGGSTRRRSRRFPDLPPGSYPYWIIPPAPPMLPSPAPGNRKPVNSAPISLNPKTGAAQSAGGLPGMLYAIMQESEAKPDGDPDTNPQGASQALPERRLGRRTKRQSSDPDQSS